MAAVTHGSTGGTQTLVGTPTTTTVATKGLTSGTGITLTPSGTDVTITNSDPASGVTLTNAGTTTLVNDGTGPALATKGLVAGTGMSFSTSATDVTITNSDPASGVTLTSAGGTETLVNDGTGPSLATKGLTAGTGISLSGASTAVTITNSDPASGVTLTNAGTTTLVNDGTGPSLAVKGLVAGVNLAFSTSSTDVTINSSISETCIIRSSTGTTINNGANANITYDVEEYDPAGMHSTSMNTERINILSDGTYLVEVSFRWSIPGGATGVVSCSILRDNGGSVTTLATGMMALSSNACVSSASRIVRLTSGDFVYTNGTNSSGGNSAVLSSTLSFGSTILTSPLFSVIKLSS